MELNKEQALALRVMAANRFINGAETIPAKELSTLMGWLPQKTSNVLGHLKAKKLIENRTEEASKKASQWALTLKGAAFSFGSLPINPSEGDSGVQDSP